MDILELLGFVVDAAIWFIRSPLRLLLLTTAVAVLAMYLFAS